jgi:hypothetical protein
LSKRDGHEVAEALLAKAAGDEAGLSALDDARAQGTLPPEDADRLAVEEVKAVRRAQQRAA